MREHAAALDHCIHPRTLEPHGGFCDGPILLGHFIAFLKRIPRVNLCTRVFCFLMREDNSMGTKRYTITVDLPEELVEKAVRLCREYWASQGEDANISSVERYLEVEARVLLRAHLQVQIEKYPHLMEQ